MSKIPIINEKDLNSLIDQAIKNNGVLTTPQEISQMLINVKGVSINTSPRKDGRYQGYIVSGNDKRYVYGKSKDEVALKIREYLKNGLPQKKKADTPQGVPTTFNSFAMYYFETFRKRKVAELTYKIDIGRYERHLKKFLNEMPLKKITPKICQDILDNLTNQGKGKTADEVHSLMSVIFKAAIKHSLIKSNPLDVVFHQKHERESGKALNSDEEKALKLGLKGSQHLTMSMLSLYTGLRPNELYSAKIDGKFIVAVNSKRKNRKTEYKKIPILNGLKPYLDGGIGKLPNIQVFRRAFKKILPNHKIYDLRTTFYSRCKEYGVSEHAIKAFMGHSLGEIANAYTDLSEDFLLREAEKLNDWI